MRYILVLFLLLSSLYADRDGGPYIGLGYGDSTFRSDGLYDTLKEDKSAGATIYVGAYINKHLSVEFNYVDFSTFGTNDGYEVNDTQAINFFALNVSTLAHYAFFNDVWDFYAKFGVGEVHQSNSQIKGFSFVYGAGTAIRFGELVSLKIAFDRYDFGYDKTQNNSSDFSLKIDYIYTALEFQF